MKTDSSTSKSVAHTVVVATLVALGAWAGNVAVRALAGEQGGIFWSQIASDTGAAWMGFVFVIASPLLLRFVRLDFARWGRAIERNFGWFLAASALLFLILMWGGARALAHAPDEVGAITQARTFAAGHLTPRVAPELVALVTPRPLQGDIFQISRATGLYTPTYWPGYALLMAPFAFLHIEWACNAVITVLSLWMLCGLARRLTGVREAGVWAAVFALSSAQIALSAACYFSMPAHLLFNLLFLGLWLDNTRRSAFFAGLVGGFALVLHNPVPHFSFALPFVLWACWNRRTHIGPLFFGYALLFLPIGLGWSAHLQGFDAGQAVHASQLAATTPFAEVSARLATAFKVPDRLLLLARGAGFCKFIVWATPGLAGVALLGWLQTRRSKTGVASAGELERVTLRLLGVSLAFNFALYFAVNFDQGAGWGFRYLHQSWMILPLAGAAFMVRQPSQTKRIAALWCLLGFLVLTPLRAVQMRQLFSDSLALRPPASSSPASITFAHDDGRAAQWIINDPFLRSPHWNLCFVSRAANEAIARRFLRDAKRDQSGKWGETWSGTAFLRSGSP